MKYSVWSLIMVIVLSIVILSGCDQTTEPWIPAEVEILSPATGVVLSGVTDVSLSILNDDDLKHVQILIDGEEAGRISKGVSKWAFNPVFYNDGQNHTMIAISTDKDGNQSQSGVVSFSVDPSTVLNVVYTAPTSGYIYAENEEVIIDWEPVVNAAGYTVQFSDDMTFDTVTAEQTTESDQVSFGVLENKIHYFRIMAENSLERTSGWSAGKKIYVGMDEITWMNVYDYSAGPEWAYAVTDLPDNTLITVGPSWDAGIDYAKTNVVKTDLFGDVIWTKFIGPDYSITYGIDVLNEGDYFYIAGVQASDSYSYDIEIFLTKFDIDGNTVWSRTYGSFDCWLTSMSMGPDGFLYLNSDYEGTNSILKIDTDGNLVFSYSQPDAYWLCFDFDHNDELVILYADYFGNPRRVKLNEIGDQISDESFGTSTIDYSQQLFADPSGIYVYEEERRFIKFGYDGNIIAETDLTDYEIISFIRSEDYFYASGVDLPGMGTMLKINFSMEIESIHKYFCGLLTNLSILPDGSFVLCGTDKEYISTDSDMVLLKTDKLGNCEIKTNLKKNAGEKLDVFNNRHHK